MAEPVCWPLVLVDATRNTCKKKKKMLLLMRQFETRLAESKTLCELFGVPPATLSHVANRPTSESSSCQPVVLYHFNVCDRFMLLFASKMCQSQICCLCGFWKGSTDAVSSNFRYFFQS
ncbi:hypothetical protein PC129_g17730 [Phytophthora cactorum]|uniref:Uncharacterized protein n=1 Tax=Phytophthora cactorum TaxID=29920 RepID=A0A8T1B479_9STRA|nr:hypothetical protein PC111_g18026 [Phytophthora cactorum]KAG2883353.1 hypothetical protein PC114_g20633 [Phytophthora cactorum]KAG2893784.1 hypothetical protein PC115_g18343 [Phytophthora cactorum]KAG3063734.1 hypothetical protein PC122_g18769 [Phytophthora cactorum]KAG3211293.1 hypothetical protein PC129_g17730 [Phytophthora cactorum]